MTMKKDNLPGKIIAYFDSFSNTHDGFTIQEINYDAERDGYEIRGSQSKDFFFLKSREFATLLIEREYTRPSRIDGCPCRETFTIKG